MKETLTAPPKRYRENDLSFFKKEPLGEAMKKYEIIFIFLFDLSQRLLISFKINNKLFSLYLLFP